MEAKSFKCKNCLSDMIYDEEKNILKCPNCGHVELIEESDEITKERIKSKTIKDVKNIEKEKQAEKFKHDINKSNIHLGYVKLVIILLVIGLVVYEVQKIIIAVKHIGYVEIPMSSQEYMLLDVDDAEDLLIDTGFDVDKIQKTKKSVLEKKDQSQCGNISQLSIDGVTSFEKGDWFSKEANINIIYLTLDPEHENDVCIPDEGLDYVGEHYSNIYNIYKKTGFDESNIKLEIIEDLTLDESENDCLTTKVTVNGIDAQNLKGDSWVGDDSEIIITYHTYDPERIKDIKIPNSNSYYKEKNYLEVYENLSDAGFTNISLEPKNDVSFASKNEDDVIEVVIAGELTYEAGKYEKPNSEIIIRYHSKELEYLKENKDEVLTILEEKGFSDICAIGLEDLQYDELKKSNNEVTSILVNGEELSSSEIFKLNEKIYVYYHSQIIKNESNVELTVSKKELTKMNYKDAYKTLKEAGFNNVYAVPLNDLSKSIWSKIKQMVVKEGQIKSIVFGDNNKIEANYFYDVDMPIKIEYHSY